MSIQEYIESGILELYAAGTLSEAEQRDVELMINKHPEIKNELIEIEKAFEAYASAFARKPNEKILVSILNNIDTTQTKASQINYARQTNKIVELKPKQNISQFTRYLALAATILLFLSIALNVYYFNSYKRSQNELSQLRGEKELLANQFNTIQTQYNQIAGEMNTIKSPANVAVTLKGMPLQPDAVATVFWNKSTGTVYININNLPAPPAGKQYQLWALKDGNPIDAGVFTMNNSLQEMKNISSADAFAVTLEKEGGSQIPTLTMLFVMGNV